MKLQLNKGTKKQSLIALIKRRLCFTKRRQVRNYLHVNKRPRKQRRCWPGARGTTHRNCFSWHKWDIWDILVCSRTVSFSGVFELAALSSSLGGQTGRYVQAAVFSVRWSERWWGNTGASGAFSQRKTSPNSHHTTSKHKPCRLRVQVKVSKRVASDLASVIVSNGRFIHRIAK